MFSIPLNVIENAVDREKIVGTIVMEKIKELMVEK